MHPNNCLYKARGLLCRLFGAFVTELLVAHSKARVACISSPDLYIKVPQIQIQRVKRCRHMMTEVKAQLL